MSYDSTESTKQHIARVNQFLNMAAGELIRRGYVHDKSKLESPEKEYFDKETPLLAGLVYGTPEYRESCKRLAPALEHHYAHNSHHPQHYKKGVNDMDLFDVIEMLYDWKASTERGLDGNIHKSIGINAEKYGISKQLRQILTNTINRFNF